MRSVAEAGAVRKMTGVEARSGSLRMPLQMSRPSESGSMISSRIRSGRTCRHSSRAPFPVCNPVREKPSFSRLYFNSEKRSVSSSISRIFFMAQSLCCPQPNRAYVTEWLRGSEFGIKLFAPSRGLLRRECEKERRALADDALHARGSVQRRHQVLDNGKTQTGAAQFARAGLIHAVEALEEARQVFGGNSDSGVADTHLD